MSVVARVTRRYEDKVQLVWDVQPNGVKGFNLYVDSDEAFSAPVQANAILIPNKPLSSKASGINVVAQGRVEAFLVPSTLSLDNDYPFYLKVEVIDETGSPEEPLANVPALEVQPQNVYPELERDELPRNVHLFGWRKSGVNKWQKLPLSASGALQVSVGGSESGDTGMEFQDVAGNSALKVYEASPPEFQRDLKTFFWAALTGSFAQDDGTTVVDVGAFTTDKTRYNSLTLYIDYTKASATSVEIIVEFSPDNVNWFQESVPVDTGSAPVINTPDVREYQLSATGARRISIDLNDGFYRIKAKETGTVGGTLTVQALACRF